MKSISIMYTDMVALGHVCITIDYIACLIIVVNVILFFQTHFQIKFNNNVLYIIGKIMIKLFRIFD